MKLPIRGAPFFFLSFFFLHIVEPREIDKQRQRRPVARRPNPALKKNFPETKKKGEEVGKLVKHGNQEPGDIKGQSPFWLEKKGETLYLPAYRSSPPGAPPALLRAWPS